MKPGTQKLSVKEKAGYGLGDSAANFVFQTMMFFQLIFYTDTFGITATAAGTLLVVARFWDAIFDPFMGIIADRTKTRWGKFRPWILWTAVPFGIMALLTFTTPKFGPSGKLIYAYVTYILFMMIYSANNLPYSALSGVMTGDMVERTSLSSYRFFFAMSAALIIQGLALPMVNFFGQGNDAKGYQITIGIFGLLAVIFFITTFATTKERIKPDPGQKTSLKQDFSDLIRNQPWIIMFIVTLLVFITLSMRNGVFLYFFKYYMDKQSLINFIERFGLSGSRISSDPSRIAFSIIVSCGQIVTILSILSSKTLASRFGKRNVYLTGILFTAIFTALFMIIPPKSVMLILVLNILWSLAYGPTIPLLWAMMADVADYSEWKNRRRATGVIFAAIVFGLKAGLGFGGAIVGWLLNSYGYVPNVEQSTHALLGIRLTLSIYPAILFFICVIALFFYQINLKMEFKIQDELAERRKSFNNNKK